MYVGGLKEKKIRKKYILTKNQFLRYLLTNSFQKKRFFTETIFCFIFVIDSYLKWYNLLTRCRHYAKIQKLRRLTKLNEQLIFL